MKTCFFRLFSALFLISSVAFGEYSADAFFTWEGGFWAFKGIGGSTVRAQTDAMENCANFVKRYLNSQESRNLAHSGHTVQSLCTVSTPKTNMCKMTAGQDPDGTERFLYGFSQGHISALTQAGIKCQVRFGNRNACANIEDCKYSYFTGPLSGSAHFTWGKDKLTFRGSGVDKRGAENQAFINCVNQVPKIFQDKHQILLDGNRVCTPLSQIKRRCFYDPQTASKRLMDGYGTTDTKALAQAEYKCDANFNFQPNHCKSLGRAGCEDVE